MNHTSGQQEQASTAKVSVSPSLSKNYAATLSPFLSSGSIVPSQFFLRNPISVPINSRTIVAQRFLAMPSAPVSTP